MTRITSEAPDWNTIPALSLTSPLRLHSDTVATANTGAGPIQISLYPFGARLRFGERTFGNYEMLVDENAVEQEAATLELDQEDDTFVLTGAGHSLHLHSAPLRFELFKDGRPERSVQERFIQQSPTDGHFVRQFRLPPVAKTDEGWFFSLELGSNEPVYGLGEKWGKLDKRGQLIRSFNHDALGVNAEISYKNTPFAWSPTGWGLFVHTPAPVTHGIGFAPWSQRSYGVLVEDSHADLFLLSGDTGANIIGDYTTLTGRAPEPPPWSLGVILSKAYYQNPEELLETAKGVRGRNMPCDVITLDGRAWQDTDTRFAFEWDAARYPDPAAVLNQLKAMDFKICIWEYPLVSVENPLFEEMSQKGWLLKDRRTGETYRYQWDMSCFDEVLTPLPDSGIVDFTHPNAYAFWRESHKPLFDLGVDMIKADFGEQIEPDMLASNGDHGQQLHNVYSLLYNRCVYEAASKYCKTGPFLFSRSAWTGSQRYPAQWGGDPQADWGGFAGNVRGGLSWGMSGAPFYATDIGGFYGDQRDSELYVRWAQQGVFSAHMRLHGIGQREPWSYGPEADAAATAALKLRYRLLPYIQETMRSASKTGLPVQQAMALAFPEDRAAWAFENQYVFGDKLLVVPCLEPDGEVEFYLPEGQWQQFLGTQKLEGGKAHKLTLALDEIAAFVRVGDSIPLGPELEHTDILAGNFDISEHWQAD